MTEAEKGIRHIPLEWIMQSPYQSRKHFDSQSLQDLSDSIQLHGVIQPIILRQLHAKSYELVAGERRWRASQLACIDSIPAIVRNISDTQACQLNTVENIQRVDLNPAEEARAYQRLIDDFGYTHEEIGQIVSKSRAKITNLLRLLTLPDLILSGVGSRKISESQAKSLLSLKPREQLKLFQQCVQRGWSQKQLEGAIAAIKQSKSSSIESDHDLSQIENRLSGHLGCRTAIDFKKGSGVLHIHFHDLDVLQGVLEKMGYQECLI